MDITRYGDTGTPELLKKENIQVTIVEGQAQARRTLISPLHTMHARKIITITQFMAGNKLYELYRIGYIGNNSCEIQDRVDGSSSGLEMTEKQAHAAKQFTKAIIASGADKALIWQVCIDEIPLTTRDMQRAKRYKLKKSFLIAIDRVAKSLGYK